MKEHLAEFKVRVPIEFTFKARETVDCDLLLKMAKSYSELALTYGDFDVKEKELEIIDKKVLLSPEEVEEKKAIDSLNFDEWMKWSECGCPNIFKYIKEVLKK